MELNAVQHPLPLAPIEVFSMRITLWLLLCLVSLPTISSHAQAPHGQVILSFLVFEQAHAVSRGYPGTDRLGTRFNEVYVGPCTFHRRNALDLDSKWKSYVEAFPSYALKDPFFKMEKFPKLLFWEYEDATSVKHPVRIIDKSRVGVARFYFVEEAPLWMQEMFQDVIEIPWPTDILNMTTSKVSSRIQFAGNLTRRIYIPKTNDKTSFLIRVRFDTPNNVSRRDTVNYSFIRLRLAFYAMKKDGTWSFLDQQAVPQNTVGYTSRTLKIPKSFEKAGKFKIKVQLERSVWKEPDAELAAWGGWKKIAGGLTSFEQELQQKEGR